MILRRFYFGGVLLFATCCGMSAPALEMGPALDVAPSVEATRIQAWPRAAWSEKARCWLVVWREGDITEERTEIWCARVSSDGKALDAQGIRLTDAKGVKDRPSVASDGQDFLVVWEDMRSGKDWDIHAARVSGDGKVLDPNGIVAIGGDHNQVRAVATFLGGCYLVVYQGFVQGERDAGSDGSGYVTHGMRFSPEGKALDATPKAVSDPKAPRHVWQPFAAAGEKGVLAPVYINERGPDHRKAQLGAGWVGMPAGEPIVTVAPAASAYGGYEALVIRNRTEHQPPAAVWTGKHFLVAFPSEGSQQGPGKAFRGKDLVVVFRMSDEGKDLGGAEFVVFANARTKQNPCVSLAVSGERVLLTEDVLAVRGKGTTAAARIQTHGVFLSAEGKPSGSTFLIAGDAEFKKECRQGFGAAGGGGFLVVWSEARGVDDVKVTARVIP